MKETGRQVPLDFFAARKTGLIGPGEEVDLSKDGLRVDDRKKAGHRRGRAR